MKFKAMSNKLSEHAFIENSVFLPTGESICFIDDFKEHEGYVKLNQKEVKFCTDATKRPWLSLIEKVTNRINKLKDDAVEALVVSEDDSWECLVEDAKELRTAKYKVSAIPESISTLMENEGKTSKEIVAKIIKQEKEINSRVLKIKKLASSTISSIELNTPDDKLEKIYLDFLKKLK